MILGKDEMRCEEEEQRQWIFFSNNKMFDTNDARG